MPRAIGTMNGRERDADAASGGSVSGRGAAARRRCRSIAAAPRRAPGGSRGCAGGCRPPRTGSPMPRISLARRFVLRLLPAPLGPTASTRDDVGRIDHAGGDARRETQADGAGVAAGRRDARRADEPIALLRAAHRKLGNAVGPGLVEVAAVEPVPVRDRLEPVIGARIDHERRVGEHVGVLARTARAAGRGTRCRAPRGISGSSPAASGARASAGAADAAMRGCPALECAVTVRISTSGCAARIRRISPPA